MRRKYICHGRARIAKRALRRKKYSHFPRFGERRQGLAMGSGRAMEMGARGKEAAAVAPGQRVRTREPTGRRM